MGAHASFTISMFGANGGMALEKGVRNQSVFIGYRSDSGKTRLFPFYENLTNDAERFGQADTKEQKLGIQPDEIKRNYQWSRINLLLLESILK